MSSLTSIQKTFLSAPHHAVVGASKDQSKFGTKVRIPTIVREGCATDQRRLCIGFEVVPGEEQGCDSRPPGTPLAVSRGHTSLLSYEQKEDELEGVKTVRTIGDLSAPSETSISVITPPKVRHAACTTWSAESLKLH